MVTPVLELGIDQHKHFLWLGIEWHLIVKVWKLLLVMTAEGSQILCFIKHL